MDEMLHAEPLDGTALLSPVVRDAIAHLCAGPPECRSLAMVVDWCDASDDAAYVVCPGCGRHFPVSERELVELRRWTETVGSSLACGVRPE